MTKIDLFARHAVTGLVDVVEIWVDSQSLKKSKMRPLNYLDHDLKSIPRFESIQQLFDRFLVLFTFQPSCESIAPGDDNCCYTWYECGIVRVRDL